MAVRKINVSERRQARDNTVLIRVCSEGGLNSSQKASVHIQSWRLEEDDLEYFGTQR
jgi:hypothetical protein